MTRARAALLVAVTAIAGWLCVHAQFGIGGHWGFAAEEFEVLFASRAVAAGFALFVLVPLTLLFGRITRATYVPAAVLATSILASFLFGVCFYASFLPRSLAIAFGRDLPFVSCFVLLGLAYGVAYWASGHRNGPHTPSTGHSVSL